MFSRKTIVMAILAVQVLISRPAKADDSEPASSRSVDGTPVIFDVRRSLPMEPDEPVYHDFYISAGIEAGVKKGQFLPVARQMPVHDPIQNKQQALLTIAVGKLQVIHVERNMAVARLVSELSDDERPTLEYEAVMIGDRVDLSSATMEAPKDATTQKARRKRKAAQVDDVPAAPYVPPAPHVPVAPAIVAPAAAPAAPEKVSMGVPPPKSLSADGPSLALIAMSGQDGRMSSAQNSFAILSVSNLARSSEDEFVGLFFAHGAEGVSEDLPFFQKDLRYDPEVRETERMTLNVYFAAIPTEQERLEWVERVRDMAPEAQVSFRVEAARDWLEEWKKGFKPFAFAEPFWVVPRWLEIPEHLRAHPEHVLLMEPGMAFGTGTHETTRLAAGLVVKSMQPGWRVLDVGTGTGILALICERLGGKEAIGNDIDPEARRTARENLELNRATKTVIDDRDLASIAAAVSSNPFDMVIANIIDGVLLTLADDLARALKPGGTLVLSGILTDREESFHKEFARLSGCTELSRVREGEWCASLWKKA